MKFEKELSNLEVRALVKFVLDKNNDCKLVDEKYDPDFMNEGLRQSLYCYPQFNEYVFIVKQKGYVVNTILIDSDEIDYFKELWKNNKLDSYGNVKGVSKKID